MARIRSIKPDFWDSADTARASLRTRLLYIAMWNWADDYGIGDGHPGRIITFAFPNDDIPAADYPRLLADVSDAFGVVFFGHLERPYYTVPAFDKHQRTEKKAKPKDGLLEAAAAAVEADVAARQAGNAESPRNVADSPTLSAEPSGAGSWKSEGEREEEREEDERVVDVPAHIDNPSTPSKRHASSAAKTLVRLVLGENTYPRTTVERLGVQADKLLHDGADDRLIRDAIAEWDRRDNCDKPEFLPTVYSDVVKRTRAAPGVSPGEAKVLAWAELGDPNPQLERRAIGQ